MCQETTYWSLKVALALLKILDQLEVVLKVPLALKEQEAGRWKFENGTVIHLVFLPSVRCQDSVGSARGAGGKMVQHFCISVPQCLPSTICVCVCFVFLAIYHAAKANGILIAAQIVITAWLTW